MEYIVQPGDTIYEIGRRFGYTVEQIVAANPNLKDPNLIYPGEVLELPEPPVDGHPLWCGLILWSHHPAVAEPGMALVHLDGPRRVTIMARRLPPAKTVSEHCAKYMVWVLGSTDPVVVRACFALQPAYFADAWFASREVEGLCRQDHIRVTAEPMEHGAQPSDHMIMGNHMDNCCHGN